MNTPGTLHGLRVLVTRPVHQAENLCRLLEARGAHSLRLPLLSIEPLANPAAVTRLLDSALTWNGWIFTSRNAVDYARRCHRGPWCARLYAVGAATLAALESSGLSAGTPVRAFSSEALLELPELQPVQGQRLLIVTGEQGLDVLAASLRARAATVEIAEVYRRLPMPYDEARVLSALRGTDAIVITSGEALQHLWRLTPESSHATLQKKVLVVPSARVVEQASALGFTRAHAPAQMGDAQIVQLLEQTAR